MEKELNSEDVDMTTEDVVTSEENDTEETVTEEAKESSEDNDLAKKLEEKEAESASYLERLQRTMAEFDNFRKRTTKEKSAMYEKGVKDSVEPILQIIDNFERAFDSLGDEEKGSFATGMEMIYKQFVSVLGDIGVVPIEAVGKEFDPNFHNAVTHVDDDAYGENEVVEEFQKGYMYNETVLRYSMVKVAN